MKGSEQHEWNVDVLQSTLRRSATRMSIAIAVAVPAAIFGVIALTRPGTGPIWGLAALILAVLCASIALRLKAKRDYCQGQLDRIARGESEESADSSATSGAS